MLASRSDRLPPGEAFSRIIREADGRSLTNGRSHHEDDKHGKAGDQNTESENDPTDP